MMCCRLKPYLAPAMAELIRIQEPSKRGTAAPAPSLSAFLSYAFRPLYLAGASWAAVSVAVWIFAPGWIQGLMHGVVWHAHEMLWGFVATIAVGFLMTAGANWTGVNFMQGRLLGVATVLWLVPRVLLVASDERALFVVAAVCELAFFLIAAGAMLRAVLRTSNARNYAMPWLIVALGLTDALFLWAVLQGDVAAAMRSLSAGLLVMTAIALVVGRRVIPFFAMRAINGLQVPMLMRVGHVQLALCALAALSALWGSMSVVAGALGVTGLLSLLQVWAWKPMRVLDRPLLWILYLGYAALGMGLVVAAMHMMGWVARSAVHVHVIAMAGFAVMIIGMLTRTALGHLSRPLVLDTSMHVSYGLVIAAAVARLLAFVPVAWGQAALWAAALAWITAFGLYVWRFFPLMIRPHLAPPTSFKGNITLGVVRPTAE